MKKHNQAKISTSKRRSTSQLDQWINRIIVLLVLLALIFACVWGYQHFVYTLSTQPSIDAKANLSAPADSSDIKLALKPKSTSTLSNTDSQAEQLRAKTLKKGPLSAPNIQAIEQQYSREYAAAIAYLEGSTVDQDLTKSLNILNFLSRQNHRSAQNNLGVMYLQGLGTTPDKTKAQFWFSKAADAGDPKAAHNLALMYLLGDGIERDPKASRKLLQQAADQGHIGAQTNLAVMYLTGEGGAIDNSRALKYLHSAAQAGHPEAQNSLGFIYLHGDIVKQDMQVAIQWFQQASEQGHPKSQEILKHIQASGLQSVLE